MIKVAYICEPHTGGMFSFFLRMREPFAEHDIEFNCVPPLDNHEIAHTRWADIHGMDVATGLSGSMQQKLNRLIRHLQDQAYHIVMVLPGSFLLGSLLPYYLPGTLKCVARAPLMSRGVYRPLQSMHPWLNHTVAVMDRIAHDLSGRYGFKKDEITVIYNGISTPDDPLPAVKEHSTFTVLYVGRLEDRQKNVALLPRLMQLLVQDNKPVRMMIIGDGPDRAKLERDFQRCGVRDDVDIYGNLSLDEVRCCYERAHCMVLPSRYEGCPNVMLEAMSHGVIPVMSSLQGISEVIIEDGQCGFTVKDNNPRAFCRAICHIMESVDVMRRMSHAARTRVQQKFSLQHTLEQYTRLFRSIMDAGNMRHVPLDMEAFVIPKTLCHPWRWWIPEPVKIKLRGLAERVGVNI